MNTFYKILHHEPTDKYRIMSYVPMTTNRPVAYRHTWTDTDGSLYIMQWLQRSNDPLTIMQFNDTDSAELVIQDIMQNYSLDEYTEMSIHGFEAKQNDNTSNLE